MRVILEYIYLFMLYSLFASCLSFRNSSSREFR